MLKDRVKMLCKAKGVSARTVENTLGFGTGYLSKLDSSTPNGRKLQQLADYFGVSVEYLMTGEEPEETPYYLNDDARELAEFIFHNPEYKVLFDASRKVKKEDIAFVKEMIERTT